MKAVHEQRGYDRVIPLRSLGRPLARPQTQREGVVDDGNIKQRRDAKETAQKEIAHRRCFFGAAILPGHEQRNGADHVEELHAMLTQRHEKTESVAGRRNGLRAMQNQDRRNCVSAQGIDVVELTNVLAHDINARRKRGRRVRTDWGGARA
jgi:hypothetical protein